MKLSLHPYNLIIAFLVLCPLTLLCQNTGMDTKVNDWTTLTSNNIAHLEDTSRTSTFKEALEKEFFQGQSKELNAQSIYWYRFSLSDKQDKKQLFLQFGFADFSDVFIPVKGAEGYKHYVVGNFAKRNEAIVTSSQF